MDSVFILYFAPSTWTNLKKLSVFIGPPFNRKYIIKGVQTALSHYEKCKNLGGLANNLILNIDIDKKELESKGFTSATYSKHVAALLETIVCELYSVLDGIKLIVFGAYEGIKSVQRSSVEKTFKYAYENKYGDDFPDSVNHILSDAYNTWYRELKEMRTEFTHGEVGSIHRNNDKINYFHNTLNSGKVIEDITGIINNQTNNVIKLSNDICEILYLQLEKNQKSIICGIHKGRVYERLVTPDGDLSFNSGECKSKNWFQNNIEFKCPMVKKCGAYSEH